MENGSQWLLTDEEKKAVTKFCNKYVLLLELLYRDKELNQWCRSYSAQNRNMKHCELEKVIYNGFMHEADALGFMPKIFLWKPYSAYQLEDALTGDEGDLIHGICSEIRSDYGSYGFLISHAIADGNLYHLMSTYLSIAQRPQYTLEYIMAQESRPEIIGRGRPGTCYARYDRSMGKWHLRIQLDKIALWFLSVFVRDDGSFDKFSLDREAAEDSHYEFVEEQNIRKKLYAAGDENKYFHEILIRYVQKR